jgi:hypothetical protein
MPSDTSPGARSGYLDPKDATEDLPAQYDRLREELERLMAQPVKDFPVIDELVDRLELSSCRHWLFRCKLDGRLA